MTVSHSGMPSAEEHLQLEVPKSEQAYPHPEPEGMITSLSFDQFLELSIDAYYWQLRPATSQRPPKF
ncbi:hypothetical protein [Marinobacter shengliensis]|uniref:hypothetical protein n=1 Tax=Marinobacter shengliensis TaxID=1389223 RepID=UPI00110979E9|nr:hypothetical protein [Marinobacter shengliensis]